MKKTTFAVFVFVTVAGTTLSGDHNTAVLKTTGNTDFFYSFNATEFTIPFILKETPIMLKETPAVVIFENKIKNKCSSNVVNSCKGFQCWCYVHKRDTASYISQKYRKNPGFNKIATVGKNGNVTESLPVNYNINHLEYDDETIKQMPYALIQAGFDWESRMTHIIENAWLSKPLNNPMFLNIKPLYALETDAAMVDYAYNSRGDFPKVLLGSYPNYSSFSQTIKMGISYDVVSEYVNKNAQIIPFNYRIQSVYKVDSTQETTAEKKKENVNGGQVVRNETWNNWDNITIDKSYPVISTPLWAQKPVSVKDLN